MTRIAAADRLAWIAGGFAAIAAVSGLVLPGLYRDPPFWAQQARGTDVATLFLAVPILVIGLRATRRGSVVGRLAVLAVELYLIYNYAIFAFSVAMNPLLAIYIAALSLAVWSFALTLSSGDLPSAVPATPRRTMAAVLIGVAVVFGLLWFSQIAAATFTGTVPVDVQRAGLPTNPIFALDLALFLPLCVVAGIGVLREATAAATFALPMLIWLCLTSVGIVASFVFAAWAGEPLAVVPGVLVSGIGIVTGGLAIVVARAATARHVSADSN